MKYTAGETVKTVRASFHFLQLYRLISLILLNVIIYSWAQRGGATG